MTTIPYILATAGHVDHGKSALVRKLTGTDPDQLPEEKRRGMTIDLGFAHLTLCSPPDTAPPAIYEVGVIDVPGHEDFVKNMVAGVGSIDAVLFVVAADDGWMPQTEEHLQILEYLGVRQGIVALTKSDLASDLDETIAAISAKLHGTFLQDAAIVPTSTINGDGIEDLRDQLARLLLRLPARIDAKKPRLPVDRAFRVSGIGTVVTGTLTGGTLTRGESVIIQPAGVRARIRSLQSYHSDVERAVPGSRVALNLPDIEPGGNGVHHTQVVCRGDLITVSGVGNPTGIIDVVIRQRARFDRFSKLITGQTVWLHHGSASMPAKIYPARLNAEHGDQAQFARLILKSPLCFMIGDRLVLRDWSAQRTLAGAMVLDVAPPTSRRATKKIAGDQLQLLYSRAQGSLDARALISTQLRRDGVVEPERLRAQSLHSDGQFESASADLVKAGSMSRFQDFIIDSSFFESLARCLGERIEAFHRDHPEQSGFPISDAVILIQQQLPQSIRQRASDVTGAVIDRLGRDDFARRGSSICSKDHQPALPPRLQRAGDRLRRLLALDPLNPPSRHELCPDDISMQAMKFLVASGEVVQLSPDIYLLATAFSHAVSAVRQMIIETGPLTVSRLKSHLNSSRRIMLPLLEKLDAQGFTVRSGDLRTLARAAEMTCP